MSTEYTITKYAVISQPMAGLTNTQIRNNRKKAIEEIEKQGYMVIDTVIDEEPSIDTLNEGVWYLGHSLILFSRADTVFFMKGWEKTRGCKLEHDICKAYDIKIKYLSV